MNLDERLGALTQSLELMAHRQRDSDERCDKRYAELTDALTVTSGLVNRLENKVEDLADPVRAIALAQAAAAKEMAALADAQRATQETLKQFIDSLRRGGNGRN